MLTATASLECVWLCQSDSTDSLSGQTRAHPHTHVHTYTHARTHTHTSCCVAVKYGLSFLSSKPDQRGSHQGQTILPCVDRLTEEGELFKCPLLTSLEASLSLNLEPEGPSDDCPCHKQPPLAHFQHPTPSPCPCTPVIGPFWRSTGRPTRSVDAACPAIFVPFLTTVYFQALSRSLYFLRRTDTWSLKSTGSRRNWEWTRGM